jgi:hypothetical protein
VNVPQSELTDLRSRINAAKWPERETVTDDSQGAGHPLHRTGRIWHVAFAAEHPEKRRSETEEINRCQQR